MNLVFRLDAIYVESVHFQKLLVGLMEDLLLSMSISEMKAMIGIQMQENLDHESDLLYVQIQTLHLDHRHI